jgi:thymidylate kinase
MKNGLIIGIEGSNGSGKTSLAKSLVAVLTADGINAEYVRLPGANGLSVCEDIRAILQKGDVSSAYAKFFLYMADMGEWYSTRDSEKIYIMDRSSISTIVYQTMDGVHRKLIDSVLEEMNFYIDTCILLTVDPAVAMERLENRETKTLANFRDRDLKFYTETQEKYKIEVREMEKNEEFYPLKPLEIDTTYLNRDDVLQKAVVYLKEIIK